MRALVYQQPAPGQSPPPPPRKAWRWVWALLAAGALLGPGYWLTGRPSASWLLGRPSGASLAPTAAASAPAGTGTRPSVAGHEVAAVAPALAALRAAPTKLELHQSLRDACYLAGQPLPKAEAIWPSEAGQLAFYLARAGAEQNRRPRLAESDLKAAQALAPEDPQVAMALSRLAQSRGDWPLALKMATEAHRLAPDDLHVAAHLVGLRFESGDVEAGRQEAEALLRPRAAGSKDPEVLGALLGAAIRAGQDAESVRHLAQTAMPKLGRAEGLIAEGRAYLRHFLANPRWNRDALPRVLAAGQGALLAPDARASDRTQARRLMAEAYAARAARAAERGEAGAARTDYDKAIALAARGTDAPVAEWLARRSRLATPGDDTIRVMEAALRWDPEHPVREELAKAHLQLGVALLAAGRAPLAQKPLSRACILNPDEASAWGRLAQALMAARHPAPEAVLAKLASGRLSRGEAVGQALRGLTEVGQGGLAQKLSNRLRPGWLDRQGRAWCEAERLALAGKGREARAHLAAAVKAHPSSFGWRRLAQLDQRLAGDRPLGEAGTAAEESLAKALALKGAHEDRAALLAWLKLRAQAGITEKRWALALTHLDKALVLAPHNPNLNLLAAEALQQDGKPQAALAAVDAGLLGLTPGEGAKEGALQLLAGQALMAAHLADQAENRLRLGLEAAKSGPVALRVALYNQLADALSARGQKAEAEAARRQAKQLASPEAHRAPGQA